MKFLSSSLLLARIRGVDIRFHFSMLFTLPIAYFLFRPTDVREIIGALLWLIGFVLCIFLHEVGHAAAAQLAGVEVKSIVIWLLGGLTNFARKSEKPSHNLAISAAGPLVNMLLGFFCVLGYVLLSILFLPFQRNAEIFIWGQTFINLFFSLAVVNIILIVFNLLPIYPLDGGNIMHAIMEMLFGKSNADWITLLISIPVLLALIIFGIVTRDYLLLASCILIGLAAGTLNRSFLRWLNLGINYLFKRSGYYYLQGDFERAIQYYTQDIEREPQQAMHYLARGACYLNTLQKERAIADVERALKLNPNSTLAMQLRGEIYAMDKEYDSALDLFTRAQAINPNWAVPYYDRGSVFLDQKEYPSALDELTKAISLSPQTWLFYLIRSIVHFKMGNLEAAHKDQDSALRLSEQESLVMVELNTIVYIDCLDWAEDYYARVLVKSPRSGYAYQGRADAYRVNNEHTKAIADYSRAIEILPKEARLYFGRGKSYLAINEKEKANADFQKIALLTDKLHLKRQAQELLKK
ncbi:MAG: M50 family metallopeptidase [Anaerolineales bacterium]|nr:M50 family metallopeptidase [Anaerolineales bacterium]